MSGQINLWAQNLTGPTTITIPPGVSALDFFNSSPNNLNCVLVYGDRQSFFVPASAETLTVFLSQLDLVVGHFVRNPITLLVTPDGIANGVVRIFGYDAKWRKFRRGASTATGQQVAIPVTPSGEGGPPAGPGLGGLPSP